MLEQAVCFCFVFFCDWDIWSKYAMLEQAMLARSSEERVLTPFQVQAIFFFHLNPVQVLAYI